RAGTFRMSVLRNLETKIADLVEGAFGRAFRSEITPVELARRLVREMDRHRQSSSATTVVPNEFVIWLSPEDRRHFSSIEASLIDELAAHLLEHARAEKLALPSRPHIELHTDSRLELGECGIEARMANAPPPTVVRRVGVPEPPVAGELIERAWLEVDGQRVPVGAAGVVIGRSSDSDIVVASQEVSRRHAQVRPEASGWVVVDLDSTNGVRVNGYPVSGAARLAGGDVIGIGSVDLTFEVG
ncbi:MAG TPA: DUF3662 and FHA domain-containing protein, partial [Acidimicrobiales bacterium]|nr:DUF3662 and FHA domain-containing protein [Acidimicrobiales bacterium]